MGSFIKIKYENYNFLLDAILNLNIYYLKFNSLIELKII